MTTKRWVNSKIGLIRLKILWFSIFLILFHLFNFFSYLIDGYSTIWPCSFFLTGNTDKLVGTLEKVTFLNGFLTIYKDKMLYI